MGTGPTTSRKEAATMQMCLQIQICIRLGEAQIQSSVRRERIQTSTWGRLQQDILTRSQNDHPSATTWGRGDMRLRA